MCKWIPPDRPLIGQAWSAHCSRPSGLTLAGTGIFNSDGDAWKAHRSTARPFFAKANLTDMSIYETHSTELLAVLERLYGQAVNVHDLFARFTLDTAGHFIFGARLVRRHFRAD